MPADKPAKTDLYGSRRLDSLDFMRGLIMILLTLESTGLYHHLRKMSELTGFGNALIAQFFHNDWEGLHFWDLIQPGFMFMAGVAMSFSIASQVRHAVPEAVQQRKMWIRSAWLLFWGIIIRLYPGYSLSLSALDFTDVLTQLAFVLPLAFFLLKRSPAQRAAACLIILLLMDFLYRSVYTSGSDDGFNKGSNFGNIVDLWLFGQHSQTYVFINWVPTSVHTIAGTIIGSVILKPYSKELMRNWVIMAILSLLMGYSLSALAITPIVKPIATSSFVLVSLGYCLLFFAVVYVWIDLLGHHKYLKFFKVIGMNSIFIYLFFYMPGVHWLNDHVAMLFTPFAEIFRLSKPVAGVVQAIFTFAIEWYICLFLYTRSIFFKL